MSGFKELNLPEQESNSSIHGGKWFVFINDDYGKYTNDHCNFLHIDGKRLCELRSDSENGRIMFDTQLEAFEKSVAFYTLHCELYPWSQQYTTCPPAGNLPVDDVNSETMRFD